MDAMTGIWKLFFDIRKPSSQYPGRRSVYVRAELARGLATFQPGHQAIMSAGVGVLQRTGRHPPRFLL